MKRVAKSSISTNSQLRHVRNERAFLEDLSSPFIVKLKFAFQDDKYLYFIIDYVEGGDLFNIIRVQGTLAEDVVRTYAAELVITLQYLHDQNVIYRDLKLENIMIDRTGHIKLVDLGSACLDLGANSVWGTTDYLAPEAFLQSKVNKLNDWWALVR